MIERLFDMKNRTSNRVYLIAPVLLVYMLFSCQENTESTSLSEHQNTSENTNRVEDILENRIGGNVDSLIGRWKLSEIEFRSNHSTTSGNKKISSIKLNGDESVYINILPSGELFLNDSLVGSWSTDSIRAGITFTGNNICKHAPIFFDTPMFISVQRIYRTLTATFMDANGKHHKTTYYLIYPSN